MKYSELKAEIDRLDLRSRINLIEEIWDAIAADHGDLPLPEWQKRALDQRYQDFRAGETALREADQVYDQLRTKYCSS